MPGALIVAVALLLGTESAARLVQLNPTQATPRHESGSPPVPSPVEDSRQPERASGTLRVDFVSVGQGDAALITSPTGKTVLIDGGPHEAGPRLARFLHGRTTAPLDLVLLTHRHADHLGGLSRIVEDQGARVFLDAAYPHATPGYGPLLKALARRGVAVREATRGRTIDLGGGARLVLLTPTDPRISGTRSDVNSNSVVVRLEYGQIHMLFTGDAERETERWLLDSGTPLRADLLKVAHHGSRYASSAPFLQAVSPQIAGISCGLNNEYHHPHAEALERLSKVRARVFRTDLDGTVTALSDGQRITMSKGGLP